MNELESIAWILFAATADQHTDFGFDIKYQNQAAHADKLLEEFRKRLDQAASSDISTSNIDTENPEL